MHTLWLTTDTHFNHQREIDEFGRPADFEQQLLTNFTKQIQSDDVFIHLGDICIGDDVSVHQKLFEHVKCTRILVRGNHDKHSYSWYLRHGWDFVCESLTLQHEGQLILLTHKPLAKIDSTYFCNVHGHLHGTPVSHQNYDVQPYFHYDVAPDNHQYRLCDLTQIINCVTKNKQQESRRTFSHY